MTFEEEFPSWKNQDNIWNLPIDEDYIKECIEEFCFDKQKVLEAFIKQIEYEELEYIFKTSPRDELELEAKKRMKEVGLK